MIPHHHQWIAAVAVGLGAIVSGMTAGWTSPYIAKFTAPNCTHPLKLTPSDASWIAALRFVGRLLGTIFSATLQGSIGRKKMLLCMCLPQLIGWSLIIVVPKVSWLYASRIITGMTAGILFTASASFLGEIADPAIRGTLITLVPSGSLTGLLLGAVLGGFLSVEIFSYVSLGLTGLFFVVFVFVPESPYYHVANGDLEKAEKSLKWYKKDANVQREIEEVHEMIGNTRVNFARIFKEFNKQEHRKNIFLIIALTSSPYLAGMNTVESYAEIILTKSKIDLTPSVVVMFLTFSAVVGGLVPIILIDKVGRRFLLMASGFGLSLGYILFGCHFHMLSLGVEPKFINWLPIFSFFLIYFSIPCGLCTVRDSLLGELFPPMLKTPASFIFTVNSAITSFAVSKYYQSYVDLVGQKYVFYTFAVFALSTVLFSYLFIPETTRMNLKAIQDNLKKNVRENGLSAASVRLISKSTGGDPNSERLE